MVPVGLIAVYHLITLVMVVEQKPCEDRGSRLYISLKLFDFPFNPGIIDSTRPINSPLLGNRLHGRGQRYTPAPRGSAVS